MTRDQVIEILRRHVDRIRARGVLHLSLFGSVARGDAGPDSDVDVLVEVADVSTFSLFDHAGLEILLKEMLGRETEVATRGSLKSAIRDHVLAEAVEIF